MELHNQPIRVGIIGLGGVGTKVMNSFDRHPQTEVVAVCDASSMRVEEAAAQHEGLACYTDYRDLLAQEAAHLDLVYIAVPPKFHHQIALDVVAAGKHIFCEKPLALSAAEAEEMLAAAEQAGVVHAMNFPTYYRRAFQLFSQKRDAGFLGDLRRLEVRARFHTWPRPWQETPWIASREQGGFVREVFPHYLQLILKTFGAITDVDTMLELPDDVTKCETGITGRLTLADGTLVVLDGISGIAEEERITFTAYGTKGTLQLLNWAQLRAGGVNEPLRDVALTDDETSLDPNAHLQELITEIVKAMRGEEADVVDFRMGLAVQQVLDVLLTASPLYEQN